MKRRTEFELRVTGRTCTAADFLRYAEYEQRLEKLRKIRANKTRSTGIPTVSTYSIPRHVTNLLSMATRRFPTNKTLWHALINHVKSITPISQKQVSKVLTSAIAAQPNDPEFWLVAIRWNERHEDASTTRKLIMRSLRFVKQNKEIWSAWIRLEIAFADKLRKRWGVLGIGQKGKEKAVPEVETPTLDGHQDEQMQVLSEEVDEIVASSEMQEQDAVLNGQLVKLVISNALQGSSFPLFYSSS